MRSREPDFFVQKVIGSSMNDRIHVTSEVAAGIMIGLSLTIIAVAGWLAFIK
jgi:hypothetical protein